MARATVLGKRKNDFQPSEGVETRKRRALRSSFNDENADPEILCDASYGENHIADPFVSTKAVTTKIAPAKHSGNASGRIAFSPAKINGHFRASKPNTQTCGKVHIATPQTPRHRDALAKPVTPRHRVQVTAKLPMTPRTPRTPSGSTTLYNSARQLFSRSATAGKLVGRDEEREELTQFIEGGIKSRSGRCLYISGPPGTGKSAFVGQVCNGLSGSEDVRVSYLNCMSIKTSKDLVNGLIKELSGEDQTVTKNDLSYLRNLIFPSDQNSQQIYMLTLDEIDHLLTLDLEVVYTLFEWALNPISKLILIGIANALDLTDRFLPRLKSRSLRPQLLPFVPYTVSQISNVIITRLKTLSSDPNFVPFVHPTAVQFCAKKVATQTGDLRKAFDLIRRTIDMVEVEAKAANQSQGSPLSENINLASPSSGSQGIARVDPLSHLTPETAPRATISHIAKIAASALNNGTTQRLKTLNLQQKAALCSLLALEKRQAAIKRDLIMATPSKSANQPPTIRKLYDMYGSLCKRDGKLAPLERNEFADVVGSLEGLGLVRGQDPKTGLKARREERGIVSSVSEKEVEESLDGVVGGLLMGLLKGDEF